MKRRPPRSTLSSSSAASDVYKRQILELEKSASNEQVKKSYRDLAKKHHPDKVQHLGDVYVKAAQDKFQQIQKAYQNIKDERGF